MNKKRKQLLIVLLRTTRIVVAASLNLFVITPNRSWAQDLPVFRIANGNSGETPAVLWVGVRQGLLPQARR